MPPVTDMPFLLVFKKATDAAETLLLFTVCPGFLEVHSSLSLSCRFSSLGWKHCSRHDLILLNISERDSLLSQDLLEALVREILKEKSIVWEGLFSISGSICFRTESCSVDILSIMTLPPLPIRLLANPIHLLGTVSVVRQCLYLNLSKSAKSEFSHVWLAWSKRGA